jgi:hypothetical protein
MSSEQEARPIKTTALRCMDDSKCRFLLISTGVAFLPRLDAGCRLRRVEVMTLAAGATALQCLRIDRCLPLVAFEVAADLDQRRHSAALQAILLPSQFESERRRPR